ncbi:hypothetical protein ACG98H_05215 [Corynebacterium sp. L4756]
MLKIGISGRIMRIGQHTLQLSMHVGHTQMLDSTTLGMAAAAEG